MGATESTVGVGTASVRMICSFVSAPDLVSRSKAGSLHEHSLNLTFGNVPLSWHAASNFPCRALCNALELEEDPDHPGDSRVVLTSPCGSVVWMETLLPVEQHYEAFDVSFDTCDLGGCDNCIPLLYLGRRAPCYPAHFTTDFKAFSEKWQTHRFTVPVPEVEPGGGELTDRLVLAIGFADLDSERAEVGQGMRMGLENVVIVPHLLAANSRRRTQAAHG